MSLPRPVLLLVALGCADDPPRAGVDPCDRPLEARIALSAEGVTMVHGPQGGWHVWVAAELAGAASAVVVADVTITAGDVVVSEGPENLTTIDLGALGAWDPETCTGGFSQAWAYLNDALPPDDPWRGICELAGQELAIDLTVSDAARGESAHASAVAVAVLDPADESLCAEGASP